MLLPQAGGREGLSEESHLGWVPWVRESWVRAGVPAVAQTAAGTAPGTRGSGNADLTPQHAPAPPPPPHPGAAEHRAPGETIVGGGRAEGKRDSAPGRNDERLGDCHRDSWRRHATLSSPFLAENERNHGNGDLRETSGKTEWEGVNEAAPSLAPQAQNGGTHIF